VDVALLNNRRTEIVVAGEDFVGGSGAYGKRSSANSIEWKVCGELRVKVTVIHVH
jgi:hypothetical protein